MKAKRKPVITVQLPDAGAKRLKDHFHRIEADSGSADDLHAALDRIIAEPVKHRIGFKEKPAFGRRRTQPDGETLPGVEAELAAA